MYRLFSILLLSLLFYPVSHFCLSFSSTGRVASLAPSIAPTNAQTLAAPATIVLSPFNIIYGCESGDSNRCFQVRSVSSSPALDFLTLTQNAGAVDGLGATAQFNGPQGIEVLATTGQYAKLFISDTGNHVIRLLTVQYADALSFAPVKVTVATLAGAMGAPGNANGITTAARFFFPRGLALARGGLLIADTSNHVIRYLPLVNDSTLFSTATTITSYQQTQLVTTLSGVMGVSGVVDGPAGVGLYSSPVDLAVAVAANSNKAQAWTNTMADIYIVEEHGIAVLNSTNYVRLLAGSSSEGLVNGVGLAARFSGPVGIEADALGNLYIVDQGNNIIRSMQLSSGIVSTIIDPGNTQSDPSPLIDGHPLLEATLYLPTAVALYSTPSNIQPFYLADSGHNAIRNVSAVCVLPCQNGGVCTELNGCLCVGDWTDVDCSKAICAAGCFNGQVCLAPDVCGCPVGFNGTNCLSPICPLPCLSGNCTAPNTCSCSAGWYSSTPNGPCDKAICHVPCGLHGDCTAPDQCTCHRNWNGSDCSIPYCALPCQNGFACTAPNHCNCSAQYTNVDCSAPVCTLPCLHGGTCVAPDACSCPSGLYQGVQCESAICSPSCVHGLCTSPGHCDCSTGWKSSLCDQAICSMTCQFGGNCTAPNNCTCPSGWGGPAGDCTQPICSPPCFTAPPFSSGRAYQQCQAASVYPGFGTAPPPVCASGCVATSCLNGGYCSAPDACTCVGQWTGSNCSIPTCPHGCANGGLCTGPDTCTCLPGYFPSLSTAATQGCSGIACSCWNGQCATPNNCTCNSGWLYDAPSGNCSTAVCDFPIIPYTGCANNGTCVAPATCTCLPGYDDGLACLQPQCPVPCLNGGSCVAPSTCLCPLAFEGLACESLIVPAKNFFDANASVFYVIFGALAFMLMLAAAWQLRKRKDLHKKRKFAYASEFDARKEIIREKKRKQKERLKLAAEKTGNQSGGGGASGTAGLKSVKGSSKYSKGALSSKYNADGVRKSKKSGRSKGSAWGGDEEEKRPPGEESEEFPRGMPSGDDDEAAQLIDRDGDDGDGDYEQEQEQEQDSRPARQAGRDYHTVRVKAAEASENDEEQGEYKDDLPGAVN